MTKDVGGSRSSTASSSSTSRTNRSKTGNSVRQLFVVVAAFLLGIWSSNIFQSMKQQGATMAIAAKNVDSFTGAVLECNCRNNDHDSTAKSSMSSKERPTHRRSFMEILKDSGSDKYTRHHYERYYEPWFEGGTTPSSSYRTKPNLRMLEIGAQHGKSLQ